ncbi:peptidase M50 [Alkalilimnicola ehrlichii]|uniref:Zinc metalloprotease n=1 Tax=Alkalilimnicola ehrlichii TaxID=351052 RepID=A0A3E0X113_9GAMM|nr:site-2 protease family protein [Alkalilimnicola ehrlichii]RFA30536.1 peptidase M50 [Alkalilimnicola ehrlichii]RFA38083.1 peptidase M50 [Alkalilimnicola ehrlichii]
MGRGIRLGRIAGIEVMLDWSLLIIFLLISFSLAVALFPVWHPDWGPLVSWATALAAAVLFLGSVLLHELSHALVGRQYGMSIKRITLFIFGGMAHMEDEPRTWRAEFWMAIAGPLMSFAIGFVCLFAAALLGATAIDPNQPQAGLAQLGPLATLLLWLGPINIILAIFNLVPGFPLDGGRVLRALLWGATGSLHQATRAASMVGQMFAWLLIAAGIAMILGIQVPIFGTGLVGGLWLTLIGWFLNNAALTSYRQMVVRESLAGVPVSRIMQTEVHTVPVETNLQRLIDEHLMHTDQRAFPITDKGRLRGLVCLDDIRRTSRADWPRLSVTDVMTPLERLTGVGPDTDAAEALTLLSSRAVNQLPVIEHGRLIGFLRREDVLRWLSWRYGADEQGRMFPE